jgi:hypothetical protein
MMEETPDSPATELGIWRRGLYMLLFALLYSVAEVLMAAVALFQFIHKLLNGKTNLRLLTFGQSLSVFVYQIWRFLTFNSDALPFPFAAWPNTDDNSAKPPQERI